MQTLSFFSMSLKIGRVLAVYLSVVILGDCKNSDSTKFVSTYTLQEMMIDQVVLSSEVYRSFLPIFKLRFQKDLLLVYRYSYLYVSVMHRGKSYGTA